LKNIIKAQNLCYFKQAKFASFQKWVYAEKSQLINVEFVNAFEDVQSQSKIPFCILDVREDEEIEYSDIPTTNGNNVTFTKINIPLYLLMQDENNLHKLPKDKYIICLCHEGVRSAHAAFFLNNRGFKALNLIGGINAISKIWKDVKPY